ncbi:protein ACN9-like protein, mitochondrial [Polychytrium aggregatum]|uniref:protein ACN9-like protein, mitochondrial n=1 Tax=Polychytrium aggregatum TaxID=110093 RepID=UPI0022FF07FF|nr:protein ACN9-like protein, mitochondrial [Polychytrium aggregatum]KAI9206238.1 protein ACN9-like protein, mitochondrial [Polychytrium aggregatum]
MTLPPILDLYRSIRRLHRRLPRALSLVGNNYIRDEFRRHRKADPAFVQGFSQSWTEYHEMLKMQLDAQAHDSRRVDPSPGSLGRKLSETEIEAMNGQQLGQLYALREAAKGESEPKS